MSRSEFYTVYANWKCSPSKRKKRIEEEGEGEKRGTYRSRIEVAALIFIDIYFDLV